MPVHNWTRVYAGIFHDFHLDWIFTLKQTLNQGLLPPDYYALAEQVAGGLQPDVLTLERKQSATPSAGNGPAGNGPTESHSTNGSIALAVAPPPVRFTASAEEQSYARKRKRIAIRHVSDDEVVALIEIVSPGNKSTRHALRAFVEKAVEFLDAGIHLLVLDLFPPGPRDPQGLHAAIWSEIVENDFRLPPDKPLTLVSYSAGDVKRAFIDPVAVADELPSMPLFLEAERYVLVPLEAPYRTAFAAVPKRWRDELDPPPTS
jgi:hypothetical protein